MQAHDIATNLYKNYCNADMNEADTRHKVIDVILHEVLLWPKDLIRCEQNTREGFADYILSREGGHNILVIEAKRSGKYFELPQNKHETSSLRRVKLRTLMTNKEIGSAVQQAKGYATDIGCTTAGITNGNVWIIFQTFVPGKSYEDSKALVIDGLLAFSQDFTALFNLLSYEEVTGQNSLAREFSLIAFSSSDISIPKRNIIQYDATMNENSYARYLRPIGNKFLRDIPKDDANFMESCYVEPKGLEALQHGISSHIVDKLTPFFANEGVSEITGFGKQETTFSRTLSNNVWNMVGEKVIILFGGKGCGKSTFLERLLFLKVPPKLSRAALPLILDFLTCPQSRDALNQYVWEQLVSSLDKDSLLQGDIQGLLSLFSDRYEVARKQTLAGLPEDSVEFVTRRNDLVSELKKDLPYCARQLRDYWWSKSKRLLVVLDNTDQLPGVLQDQCFLIAQAIANELDCLVVISMREERYCRAKTNGVLDAYHNSGYHLPSPDQAQVFRRRLQHIITLLNLKSDFTKHLNIPENAPTNELVAFLTVCVDEFRKPNGHLKTFLENCSHGNLRLALDFFRDYMSSGYTQIDEMIRKDRWSIARHQVLTPIMVPKRQNYEEEKSAVPNIYQLRNNSGITSHFSGLRLLSFLNKHSISSERDSYVAVSRLLQYFEETFSMKHDAEYLLDLYLKHGIVEADNRVDQYKTERLSVDAPEKIEYIYADQVKITAFGRYLLEELSSSFTYLHLVSLDCAVRDSSLCSKLQRAANNERQWSIEGGDLAKSQRLQSRIERVDAFIDYLKQEEQKEREYFGLGADAEEFSSNIYSQYTLERKQVSDSALRRFEQND